MSRRVVYGLMYISTIVLGCFIIYIMDLKPNLPFWTTCPPTVVHVTAPPKDEPNKSTRRTIPSKEIFAFDRLLNHILHPKISCKSAVVLGGILYHNIAVDGDKVICLKPGVGLRKPCTVYSVGVGNDFSFEEDIASKFGCQVYAFDPTMNVKDHKHSEGVWFHNIGLVGSKPNPNFENMKTLDKIIEMLGHQNKTLDVLKMDIEGNEYSVITDLLEKKLLKWVNHLNIEIHLLVVMPHDWNRVYTLFKRIEVEAGLRLFNTRNNTIMKPFPVNGIPGRYEQHFFEMAWFRY